MAALPYEQEIQQAIDALPMAVAVLFLVMAAVGLFIWVAGTALAKAACTVSGLVLGGLAGWFAGGQLASEGAYILPLTIGAAVAGALVAGFLFRVWMAVAGAVLLSLVLPIGALVWQGHGPGVAPGDATQTPAAEDQTDAAPADTFDVRDFVLQAADPQADQPSDEAGLWSRLSEFLDRMRANVTAWGRDTWDGLGPTGRMIAMLGAAVGALAGLLLGLLVPHISAAVQSSLAGSVMMYFGAVSAARRLLGDAPPFLPDTPRGELAIIGLITVLGVLLQWTVFRKRTDK